MGKELGFVKKACFLILTVLLIGSLNMAYSADVNEDYPLRKTYPNVAIITTDELKAVRDKAFVIDCRNKSEFDILAIKGAKNILVGKMTEEDLLKLRPKEDSRLLVFYCNGFDCSKSYKAVQKASEWGFTGARCYDAGINSWAQKFPEETLFWNKPLTAETLNQAMISKEEFNAVTLEPVDFIAKVRSGDYTLFDIRDAQEKSEIPINLSSTKSISFDMLADMIKSRNRELPARNWLVIDNVGKQVKFLQYYLKDSKITSYYFLKGGVRNLLNSGFDASGQKK